MRAFSFFAMVLFFVTACDEGLRSPSDTYIIPQGQLQIVIMEANSGDLKAVKRLISHYEAVSGSDAIAEEWRARARLLGDPEELYYYSARLLIRANGEVDPIRKREMLMDALKAAQESSIAHPTTSTQQLVEKISSSLNNL